MNFTKKIAGLFLFLAFSSTALMAQAEQTKISDSELSQFAETFQKMRMMNQQAQMKMSEAITAEDLEIKRFNEIHKAKTDPATEGNVTAEETEKYEEAISQIEGMQTDFQKQMEDLIKQGGLSVERYQQIATRLQNDAQLQERLRAQFEK
jgi:hypothetical protein